MVNIDLSTDAAIEAALAMLGIRAATLRAAVKQFQTQHGTLFIDGIAGDLTKAAIRRELTVLNLHKAHEQVRQR